MSDLDKALTLDFPKAGHKSSIDNRDIETRWLKRIDVCYEDGEIETFELPEDQGFVRKRYTVLQGEQKGTVLICYDVHWTLKVKGK